MAGFEYTRVLIIYITAGQKANFKMLPYTLIDGGKQGYNRIIAGELKRKV